MADGEVAQIAPLAAAVARVELSIGGRLEWKEPPKGGFFSKR